MDFDWKKLVGSVAPTLATALGGPLAGMAVQAIGAALGLEGEVTEEKVASVLQTAKPELLLQLRQADQEFAKHMATVDVDLTKLVVQDRDSARNLLIQTKARTPAALSWLVLLIGMGLEGALLMGWYPEKVPDIIIGRVLGTFDTAIGIVLTYWLGSAHREPYQQKPK